MVDRTTGGIDVVVSDVAMPRMRGDELARQLAQRGIDVPIVLMTGYDSAPSAAPGCVLAKPVAPADLLRAIRKALDD